MLQALAPLASSLEVLILSGNELGGAIPSDITIFTKLQTLDLSSMGLGGEICKTQHSCVVCLLTFHFFVGELPKELGKLINLYFFNVANNSIGGELYVPAYTRCMFADILLVLQANCPRSSATLPICPNSS